RHLAVLLGWQHLVYEPRAAERLEQLQGHLLDLFGGEPLRQMRARAVPSQVPAEPAPGWGEEVLPRVAVALAARQSHGSVLEVLPEADSPVLFQPLLATVPQLVQVALLEEMRPYRQVAPE